ncbi:uncharacterized protein LOC113554847 [Rhopalosiphum maidis]|uniref:uncharacterized protein LOC113554847 n=1 Tax=Rhopalosiphum maidis TaxID=43146 RepID=UPI000EFF3353|nr:uncharacterized protein LOC113554847 [Rhopalosiphum maidis]
MAPNGVSAVMEQLTVHSASYRPIPLPLPVHRCRTPVKRTLAPSVITTAHREAYRVRDPQEPIKSNPPRDHDFLAGDGIDRFNCTSYKMHYPVKDGLHRAQPVTPPVRRSLVHVPMEAETSTGNAYRHPVTMKLWRRPSSTYIVSSEPMETTSVHRASYKPPPCNFDSKAKADICPRHAFVDESLRSAMPIKSHTTYTTSYYTRHPNLKLLGQIPAKMLEMQESNKMPRVHDYKIKNSNKLVKCTRKIQHAT